MKQLREHNNTYKEVTSWQVCSPLLSLSFHFLLSKNVSLALHFPSLQPYHLVIIPYNRSYHCMGCFNTKQQRISSLSQLPSQHITKHLILVIHSSIVQLGEKIKTDFYHTTTFKQSGKNMESL